MKLFSIQITYSKYQKSEVQSFTKIRGRRRQIELFSFRGSYNAPTSLSSSHTSANVAGTDDDIV